MSANSVPTLLAAVRRRLWLQRVATAARRAAWASAAWLLLIAAAHLLVAGVGIGALLLPPAALWAAMLAATAWRGPNDGACALWADRHLDGASAYSTWLEHRGTAAPAQALRSLEAWAGARVARSQSLLARRQGGLRLRQPLLAMLVCGALTALVLALPGALLAPSRAASATTPFVAAPDRPAPLAATTAGADLATEMASALRPPAPPALPGQQEDPRASNGSAPAQAGAGSGARADPAAGVPAGKGADAKASVATVAALAPPAGGSTQVPGAGGGRDAGESRDERADLGVSRVLGRARPVQRSDTADRRSGADRQADTDRAGTYDDERSTLGASASGAATDPSAATPPPALDTMRLSPTEASYVQAWMKASAMRP